MTPHRSNPALNAPHRPMAFLPAHTLGPSGPLLALARATWMLALGVSAMSTAWANEPELPLPTATRRAELITLVRQDCGSCHGLTLKGGLGPALLPETLKDKPMESLKATILQGRPGTPMPPWQRFVSESEAQWIVTHLQQGFPNAP